MFTLRPLVNALPNTINSASADRSAGRTTRSIGYFQIVLLGLILWLPNSRAEAQQPLQLAIDRFDSRAAIAREVSLPPGYPIEPVIEAIGSDHDPVTGIPTESPVEAGRTAPQRAREISIQFSAFARDWQLSLARVDLLDVSLDDRLGAGTQHANLPVFMAGSVIGDANSWVRLSIDWTANPRIDGHLFTEGLLYRIDSLPDGNGHTLLPLGAPEPITTIPPTLSRSADVLNASRAMRVGIVIDSRYNEHHNQRGLAHALGIMNAVDGLYQQQLGLAVIIEAVEVYDDPASDPMRNRGGTVEQMLTAFRDIRSSNPNLPDDLALVHLFSGHRDPKKVIGLGWIDTVCRVDGYDLSLSTPFPYDMLLAAHEIGHNLGALHDNEPACQSLIDEPGVHIMWKELHGGTRPDFSACSLQYMQRQLAADCLEDNIDLAVELQSNSDAPLRDRSVNVQVTNNDSFRTASGVSSRTRFPDSATLQRASAGCVIIVNELLCEHSPIAPGAADVVSVLASLSPAPSASVATSITVSGLADTRSANNQNSLLLRGPFDIPPPSGTAESATGNTIADDSPASDAVTSSLQREPILSANPAPASTGLSAGDERSGGGIAHALLLLLLGALSWRIGSRQ